jgi:hypothetical protein
MIKFPFAARKECPMMLKTLAVSLTTLTMVHGQLAQKAHPRL